MSSRRRVKNVSYDDDDLYDYDDDDDYYDEDIDSHAILSQNKEQMGTRPFTGSSEKGAHKKHSAKQSAPQPSTPAQNKSRGENSMNAKPSTVDLGAGTGQSKRPNGSFAVTGGELHVGRLESPSKAAAAPISGFEDRTSCACSVTGAVGYSSEGPPAQICVVSAGHVDAGKSSLFGALLSENGTGQLHQGRARLETPLAWLLDEGEEERARGVTVDVTVRCIDNENSQIVLIDAPGHKDFVSNMIGGAILTDAAVLVIDSHRFDRCLAPGGQTAEHAVILRALGVKHLVVAINKMDEVSWNQSFFDVAQDALTQFLCDSVGFKNSDISFIPVAGLLGVNALPDEKNVQVRPNNAPSDTSARGNITHEDLKTHYEALAKWWSGPTLMGELQRLAVKRATKLISTGCSPGIDSRDTEVFLACVSDVWTPGNTLVMGFKVARGAIAKHQWVVLFPSQIIVQCVNLMCGSKSVTWAGKGCYVTEGTFVYSEAAATAAAPGTVLSSFVQGLIGPMSSQLVDAFVRVVDPDMIMLPGRCLEAYIHTSVTACVVTRVKRGVPSACEPVTLEEAWAEANCVKSASCTQLQPKQWRTSFIPNGKVGTVRLLCDRAAIGLPATLTTGAEDDQLEMAVTGNNGTADHISFLSRIILREKGKTVAAGIITEFYPESSEKPLM